MNEYSTERKAPWNDYVSEITTVIFDDKIDVISVNAFEGMTSLTTVRYTGIRLPTQCDSAFATLTGVTEVEVTSTYTGGETFCGIRYG